VIDFLEGEVVELTENSVVLAVNGVGYRVAISKTTVEALRGQAGPVKIYTHLHYTPNDLALYGFATPEERQLFELLISVSGVGPKVAMGILSATTPQYFAEAILQNRRDLLEDLKGVGRKTAERLIVELKEKIAQIPLRGEPTLAPVTTQEELAIKALTRSLGFSEHEARRAVARAKATGATTTEELVKKALALLS
jgi:Holliday junction DNA helicase RuvA